MESLVVKKTFFSLAIVFTLGLSSTLCGIQIPQPRAEDAARFAAITEQVDQEIQQQIADCINRSVAPSSTTEAAEFLKIILFATGYAISYGVLHDQITVPVCRDYFCSDRVPHHRRLLLHLGLNPETLPSPIVACIWGTAATWWIGLILGIELSLISRVGSGLPKLSYKELLKPTAYLLGGIGVISMIAGLWGAFKHPHDRAFQFDAYAHSAGYSLAAAALVVLPAWGIYQRALKLKKGLAAQ